MTFKDMSARYFEPVSQWLMVLGIIALVQPWDLTLHSYGVTITLIGLIGMGIMLGGIVTLTNDAHLSEPFVAFFMLFTFLIVAITEILLVKQLSRLTRSSERKVIDVPPQTVIPSELRPAQPRTLAEPMQSVTENTTRTLDYSRNEPLP